MDNIFMQNDARRGFSWQDLGDIKEGRDNLGEEMPVIVYRLMQFTMRDVMASEFGSEKADDFLRKAGLLAGIEFAKNILTLNLGFDDFVAHLQKTLYELKIGVLRLESVNEGAREIVLTIGEDLDCSGLPITDEAVCTYDEGFVAGILEVYTGKPYNVQEIDCWASGDRTCRFKCTCTANSCPPEPGVAVPLN